MSKVGDLSAAGRNRKPIFDALADWLAAVDDVLEIGAGDGTHARYARERLPRLCWQASEAPGHVRRLTAALTDVRAEKLPWPLALDVRGAWPQRRYGAIFAANVAHIMSLDAVSALFVGAAEHLHDRGLLCLYGPFFAGDEQPGAGNIRFDEALQAQDPAMGIRWRETLNKLAGDRGLCFAAWLTLPADNRLLIWRRTPRS